MLYNIIHHQVCELFKVGKKRSKKEHAQDTLKNVFLLILPESFCGCPKACKGAKLSEKAIKTAKPRIVFPMDRKEETSLLDFFKFRTKPNKFCRKTMLRGL